MIYSYQQFLYEEVQHQELRHLYKIPTVFLDPKIRYITVLTNNYSKSLTTLGRFKWFQHISKFSQHVLFIYLSIYRQNLSADAQFSSADLNRALRIHTRCFWLVVVRVLFFNGAREFQATNQKRSKCSASVRRKLFSIILNLILCYKNGS